MMRDRRTQLGFSLIEAMVALLIIAVGLLGIAGLQGLSMNSTSVSRTRTIAAIEASNMAAYIGVNASFWQNINPAQGYNVTVTSGSTVTVSDSSLGGLNNACDQGTCTAQQMAAYDLKQWGSNNQLGLLPAGVGVVTCGVQGVSSSPRTCTVTVGWSQKEMAGNNTTGTTLAPAVTYFRMVVQP